MAEARTHKARRGLFSWLRHAWRAILKGVVLFTVAIGVLDGLFDSSTGTIGRVSALFVIALFCLSLAYYLYVSPRVQLRLAGLEDRIASSGAGSTTIQVRRLRSDAARVAVANRAWLPVLRVVLSIDLVMDESGAEDSAAIDVTRVKGRPHSLPARSVKYIPTTNVFNHVGIFRLQSTGVRVYDLLGLLSRNRGTSGQRRVRVVPNVYRLSAGIPLERRVDQDSLGLPETPADALDYAYVRDYRPGDPLKTIHWKLVAHSQGELFTKLFETPTISGVTLVIDPYGPAIDTNTAGMAYHLFDTMLEGGFSLIEHARENDIAGRLCFANRKGSLVEADWAGPAMLGWFVEVARRPASSLEARNLSIRTTRLLRDERRGYVLFATTRLRDESVEALINCHRAGIPLLVVHALPDAAHGGTRQRTYDARLREASIGVVGLTDGPQIVREVTVS